MADQPNELTDQMILNRAMTAFRKRIKMSRLGDESSSSRGAFSGGKVSGIVAIRPPSQFPQSVWDELVKQGRLVESNSFYEIPKR